MRPVVAIYSTFMQRAYDQILHDVCIMNFPVVFCLDRGGLAGDDGPTHQGAFDIAYIAPAAEHGGDGGEGRAGAAADDGHGREAPRGRSACATPGSGPGAPLLDDPEPLPIGVGESLCEGDDVAIVGYGYGVGVSMDAAEQLAEKGSTPPSSTRASRSRWTRS